MDYGRLLVYQYLPEQLIPGDFEKADFDTFFRVVGMASVARELRMEDIEVGVNQGFVKAMPESE